MDGFLDLKDLDVTNKIPSPEISSRWRSAATLVNRRGRFSKVVELARRSAAEEKKRKIMEQLRVAFYSQKAALRFMELKLEDVSSRESIVSEPPESIRFQEPVDDVGSTVEGHDACQLLGKYKKRAVAVFYVVLEAASILLDLLGKNKKKVLLAAFLLSVIGFSMTTYVNIMTRTRAATRVYSQKQLVRIVEIAFSVIQLVVTLIYFIVAELGVKINFSVLAFPLVFATIVAVFTFKYDEEVSDSSGYIANNLSGDLPISNIPIVEAIPSTSNEPFPIGMTVENLRHLNMTYSLVSRG